MNNTMRKLGLAAGIFAGAAGAATANLVELKPAGGEADNCAWTVGLDSRGAPTGVTAKCFVTSPDFTKQEICEVWGKAASPDGCTTHAIPKFAGSMYNYYGLDGKLRIFSLEDGKPQKAGPQQGEIRTISRFPLAVTGVASEKVDGGNYRQMTGSAICPLDVNPKEAGIVYYTSPSIKVMECRSVGPGYGQ